MIKIQKRIIREGLLWEVRKKDNNPTISHKLNIVQCAIGYKRRTGFQPTHIAGKGIKDGDEIRFGSVCLIGVNDSSVLPNQLWIGRVF